MIVNHSQIARSYTEKEYLAVHGSTPSGKVSTEFADVTIGETLAMMEAYRAARVTPRTKTWQPQHRSGDAAIAESWDLLTARIRDMARNDPGIRKAIRMLTRLVIGTGIQSFSNASEEIEALYGDETAIAAADRWEDESDLRFAYWAEHEADVTGKATWWEMQAELFREAVATGNALLLRCNRRGADRKLSLCYQVIEWEQLDRMQDRAGDAKTNRIINGIELDQDNRPVAYHLYDAHPYDDYMSVAAGHRSTRIPADRITHWFPITDQASSHSGISWLSAIVQPARDVDWYLGNELTSAAIAALLTFVRKRKHPYAGGGLDGDVSGNLESMSDPLKIGNAVVAEIGPDEEVTVAESKRPNRDADPFISLIHRMQAMGIDVSYLRMTSDYKATSYTAARGAMLDDDGMVKPLQNSFASKFNNVARKAFHAEAVGTGLIRSITPLQYRVNRAMYDQLEHVPAGREQLDPIKETDASIAKLRSGQSTLKIECGKRGYHYKWILRQQRRERRLAAQLGIPIDWSKGNGGNAAVDGGGGDSDSDSGGEGE